MHKKLNSIYERLERKHFEKEIPTVSVGVLTYNHKDYIEECLRSVLDQRGNFNLNIIICDDCSTDGTTEIIDRFLLNLPKKDNVSITFNKNDKNIGIIANLNKMINLLKESKCDFRYHRSVYKI